MRYLSIFMGSCLFSLFGFSQNAPTVTLVFVSSANNTYRNFEAVIDEVSYYSENPPVSNNKSRTVSTAAVDRNTIWLNNFQPGKHTIEVYNIKQGSHDVRAGNSPLYVSTFIVKKGFDTKIAVKSNGQVQFSERLSFGNSSGDVSGRDNNVYSPANNNKIVDKNSSKKIKRNKNNNSNNSGEDVGKSTATSDQNNDDSYNKENTSENVRHSQKRIDTAIIMDDAGNNSVSAGKNSNGALNRNNNNDSRVESDDQNGDNSKAPMDDDSFNQLYENLRNQWHPGQRMKTLTNEFLNTGDNFTTSQAKQLIKLVTEEGNRLKLAKSSYHCITDPENFSEMDDVLRYQTGAYQIFVPVRNVNLGKPKSIYDDKSRIP